MSSTRERLNTWWLPELDFSSSGLLCWYGDAGCRVLFNPLASPVCSTLRCWVSCFVILASVVQFLYRRRFATEPMHVTPTIHCISSSNRLLGYLCMYVNKTGGHLSFSFLFFLFQKYKTIFRSLYVSLNVLHPGRGQKLAAALLDSMFRGLSDTLWSGREAGNALRCVQAHTDCPVCVWTSRPPLRTGRSFKKCTGLDSEHNKRRHGLRPLSVVAPVHSYHLNV